MDIRKTLSVIVGFLAGGFFYAGPFISSALSWTIFFCFSIPVYFIWNRAYPLSRLFTLFVSFFVGFLTACVVFSWVTHVSILGAVLLAFYIALWGQIIVGVVVLMLGYQEPRFLLTLSAVLNAFAMMIAFPLVFFLNQKTLGGKYQASLPVKILFALSFLFFVYFMGITLRSQFVG